MEPPRSFEVNFEGGRVAAIAGAAGPFGEEVIESLLELDWAVAACDGALANGTRNARTMIELDMLDRGAVAGAVQTIEGEFGSLDALILLPPSLPDASIVGLSTDAWRAALRTQLLVAANFAWATVPSMVARGAGNIVVIASDAALGGPGGVLTASAAGAAIGFAKALAIELSKTGVQVNAVCTETPSPRPADIARTVRYLASEQHFFLGQVLTAGGPV